MSATKLENVIDTACKDLTWIVEAVAQVRPSGTLSEESYSFFEMSSALAGQLEDAKALMPVRGVSLDVAKSFPKQVSTANPQRFLFNGVEVTFKQGRYLVLQSYLTTAWAIYDALAKVAGILCCVDERSKNNTKPVKLPEDFLRGQKFVGARVHDHLKGAYGFPIALSYAIRNWLVHDGHSHNGIELFKSDGPPAPPYEISAAAWAKIEEKVTNEYKAEPAHTRLRPFPNVCADLLFALESCHEEADEAIGFVLSWAVGAARLQANILLPRDAAIATVPPLRASPP